MKLKKKIQLKKTQKYNPSQLRLTRQTHDLDHDIEITSYKVNKKNSLSQLGLT